MPVTEPIKSWPTGEVVAAIEKNFGLRTQVARALGCNLSTLEDYRHQITEIHDAFWLQDERINDLAELGLVAAIQRGEAWAICFRLKTKAKDRGYIERVEQDGRLAVLGLNTTLDVGSKGAQRGDFDTEGYIELFRGFFARPSDGIPTSNGPYESLDTGNPDT